MNKMRYICVALAILGILGGAVGQHYLNKDKQDTPAQEQAQRYTLATDPFSLKYFQHSLKEKEAGNVLVAPHAVSDALLSLQAIAAGKTLEELKTLQLSPANVLRAAEPARASLLAVDLNITREKGTRSVMPLPFEENVPMALSLYNGMMSSVLGDKGQLADSKMVTTRTKLLAGAAVALHLEWQIPFNSANCRTADFDSKSGGMPHFRQMRSRGLYRTAPAEDGSWKAVAIPFKSEKQNAPELVCIAILPAGSARDFATNLTPEQLTDIRRKLAEAEPQDTLVELPRLELQILPFDLRDSLRRMGLKALFDIETADYSALTPDKIHLGSFAHACSVSLVESPAPPKADDSLDYASAVISFTRPFLWLVTDLETDTPAEFIGLVEEM